MPPHQDPGNNTIERWQDTITKYFSPEGQLVQHVWSPKGSPEGQPRTKQFQIHASSLPRFYMTWFQSLQNMQLQIEGARESTANAGLPRVQCQRARYTFWYANGTQVYLSAKRFGRFFN